MGTPAPAVPTFERLVADGHEIIEVWTQPDRRSGRGNKLTKPPVKLAAEKYGVEVFQPEKVRNKDVRNRFATLDADVAVVVAYGQILTKTFLNAFEYGCINVHFSLLPRYRGAAPVNWAIANGETTTGVTTMRMDRGLDTGDVLLVSETTIGDRENSIELMERLSLVGADLLAKTLEKIESIVPIPQDEKDSSYAPLFKKSDGLIMWDSAAVDVRNRIRGFQPFPGSFTFVEGETRLIIRESSISAEQYVGTPGEVVGLEDEFPVVKCGDGALVLRTAQIAGKPNQSADLLSAAGKIKIGQTLSEQN